MYRSTIFDGAPLPLREAWDQKKQAMLHSSFASCPIRGSNFCFLVLEAVMVSNKMAQYSISVGDQGEPKEKKVAKRVSQPVNVNDLGIQDQILGRSKHYAMHAFLFSSSMKLMQVS